MDQALLIVGPLAGAQGEALRAELVASHRAVTLVYVPYHEFGSNRIPG